MPFAPPSVRRSVAASGAMGTMETMGMDHGNGPWDRRKMEVSWKFMGVEREFHGAAQFGGLNMFEWTWEWKFKHQQNIKHHEFSSMSKGLCLAPWASGVTSPFHDRTFFF